MKRVLKITLKSDLCAGSGYSYAGIIDSDACFDRYGIPYIPARRIKGCLREAAAMIGEKDEVFGSWGQRNMDQKSVFRISDAFPENYREMVQALEDLKGSEDFTSYFSAEQMRQYYSRVKAQTKIDENGVADDTSLRFTRIVNHYCPYDQQEMCFFADVEMAGEDKTLERAAKALRHMGEDRNRGLGNVRCELLPEDKPQDVQGNGKTPETDKESGERNTKNEERISEAQQSQRCILKYTIKTEAPIIISSGNSADSETCIGGTSVLGAFAMAYLRRHGMSADQTFEKMFLKNRMCFSPLYPSDEEGNIYVPAPSYIGKLKKSGELVNVSIAEFPTKENKEYGEKAENGKYFPGNGNQPKKLKGKYIGFLKSGLAVKEVKTEMIYHHRHKRDDVEEQLYVLQAIQPGQLFSGTISGEKNDLEKTKKMLKENIFRFGKSRNAQYGACRVVNVEILEPENGGNVSGVGQTYQAGDALLVTLRTDGIFLDPETGNATVRLAEVRRQVGDTLNEFVGGEYFEKSEDAADLYTELEVGELSGFYGVWNLRRPSVPCVRAGSTLEFRVKQEFSLTDQTVQVGCRKGEGFGLLDIRRRPEGWLLNGKETEPRNNQENIDVSEEKPKDIPEVLQPIFRENLRNALYREMEQKAFRVERGSLTASAVGRLTLMLTECINEYREEQTKNEEKNSVLQRNQCRADRIYEKLKERVKTVKDRGKQDKLRDFICQYFENAMENVKSQMLKQILDDSVRKDIKEDCKLYCLQQALGVLKYKMKEEA